MIETLINTDLHGLSRIYSKIMNKKANDFQLDGKVLFERQKKIRSNTAYIHAPVIIVDNLLSPENYGSVLRLADAAGCKKVVFLTDNEIKNLSKLKKTAQNCENLVEWKTETSKQFLSESIENYPNLIAIEITTNSKSLFELELPKNCAFVIGNEGYGISPELLEKCNSVVHIPMFGVNGSINVTHALGIVLFEWRRTH